MRSSGPRVDVNKLRNIDEIKQAFGQLTNEEESVNKELDRILSQQVSLETRLKGITKIAPKLEEVKGDAEQLSSLISFTATLAENVSAKVRQLDTAKSRVAECQQRVHDLIDLKLCSEGVKTALQEEDYECAAAHIHRFLAMDEGILKLTSRDFNGASSDNQNVGLDASLATLHQAENQVRGVVSKRFDDAVKDEDLASIERFFKIFPLLNMHEEGLKKFTQYLCTKVVDTSKKNLKAAVDTQPGEKRSNVIFADTLTLLFEGVARTVEIHQPLIETYYGPGRMVTVLAMLQIECDRQAARIFIEFKRKRSVSDKVSRVQEALVGRDNNRLPARDLDTVLGEMTLLQARVEMYFRFVRKRCAADVEVSVEDEEERRGKMAEVEDMLGKSGLCHCAQESLGEYILLEQYFMSENIAKAVELDTMEADQMTTSMLDDVFFIVKKCVKRATTSNSVDGICAVLNNACTLLESDFCRVFQDQIKLGFPSTYLDQAYSVIQSSLQQGKLGANDTDKQRQVFLAYLNNAESGVEYISRLQSTIEGDLVALTVSSAVSDKQTAKMTSCLSGMAAVSNKLKTVLDSGMAALRTAAVKPRVKPWVDTFMSTSHNITDDQLAEYEANDPFVQALVVNLDGLVKSFKGCLTSLNYDSLVMIVASEVTTQLEKAVLKSLFSRAGGLQFDREVRTLSSFLTSVTTWTIRDKFSRLSQMAAILNLETVQEVSDYCTSQAGMSWKLTPIEVRQVLQLRVDFKPEEIKRVKL